MKYEKKKKFCIFSKFQFFIHFDFNPKLTYIIVQHFLLSIPSRLNYFQPRLKQSQITESPAFIVQLFLFRILRDSHKDIRRRFSQQIGQGVLLSFPPQQGLDVLEGGLSDALHGDNDSCGKQAFQPDLGWHEMRTP